ncbi:hypothetical protein FA95DRAFT_1583261 [Auriscalpium vulgare]|uniref:Uncharacterized protein n=1 Tax=Auriscalpium vulgare TaxID=40419 RepID=A0ACB8RPS7_9AGAM|nr:hypothetical protein FA95DRAFT_1583261 [Auriscalpium vulgare]
MKITPVIIAGIAVAASVFACVCLWLGIRWYRKRARKQREGGRQAAFLTVKGVMPEGVTPEVEKVAPVSPRPRVPKITVNNEFSRAQLTTSIVMPNQTIVRPDATKEDIIRYHQETGTLTRPFGFGPPVTIPASNAPAAAPDARPVSTVSWVSPVSPQRTSFFAFGRPTSSASMFSNSSSSRGNEGRKVRQLFAPVLPDELVLSLGESVTVVQSFDDGWCIVGRESTFKTDEVEMGAVPAWCFMKPVKGLKAERPMRTTSLGVTVQLDAGPNAPRDELVSWSNF